VLPIGVFGIRKHEGPRASLPQVTVQNSTADFRGQPASYRGSEERTGNAETLRVEIIDPHHHPPPSQLRADRSGCNPYAKLISLRNPNKRAN